MMNSQSHRSLIVNSQSHRSLIDSRICRDNRKYWNKQMTQWKLPGFKLFILQLFFFCCSFTIFGLFSIVNNTKQNIETWCRWRPYNCRQCDLVEILPEKARSHTIWPQRNKRSEQRFDQKMFSDNLFRISI